MWIVIIYIIIYVVGVLIFAISILKAFDNYYQNELGKLNDEIENKNIELQSVLSYKPFVPYKPYDITKHTDYEYPNHNYHLIV